MFSLCPPLREVPVSQVWGVPPSQVQVGGYPLSRFRWGDPFPGPGLGDPLPRSRQGRYPFPGPDRGYPHPGRGYPTWEGVPPPIQVRSQYGGSTPYRSSIACTCYAAGGVPLAFTQEDFLVIYVGIFIITETSKKILIVHIAYEAFKPTDLKSIGEIARSELHLLIRSLHNCTMLPYL